ncbi:MAG: hypothetical protein HY674_08345 [Chloroflexi bacterium]|nr:hypothetical protein [Chloroflexota bacterium]
MIAAGTGGQVAAAVDLCLQLVSNGQTGTDRAALDWAIANGALTKALASP